MKTLRGVKYLRDASGRSTAVVIDLRRNRALWEDFVDAATARGRAASRRNNSHQSAPDWCALAG